MSVVYKILYQLGIHPWEQMAELPITREIDELFAREEVGRQRPFGRALDIGCGSGIWSVALARRGWEVTGVDVVPKALRRARKRAEDAAVDVRFVEGDVTALRPEVGNAFNFAIDFNCFHDLSPAQQMAVGRSVSGVVAPGATMLMQAWPRESRMPWLPQGADIGEIQAAFPGWTVVDERVADVSGAPDDVRKAAPRWYRLRNDA
jgi:SAM-dependent methyltransferase